jgi:hypothetical protein
MSDNVGYTPGSGATIAADDIGGVLHQRVKLSVGADGTAVDVSASNPMPVAAYGELIEAVESMRFAVMSLVKTLGYTLPNAQGFPIMEARQATASLLNATVSGSLTTLTTLSTLTNQAQIGGFNANEQIPALMHLQADNLRRNIAVT